MAYVALSDQAISLKWRKTVAEWVVRAAFVIALIASFGCLFIPNEKEILLITTLIVGAASIAISLIFLFLVTHWSNRLGRVEREERRQLYIC